MIIQQEISESSESGSTQGVASSYTWENSELLNIETLMGSGFHYGHTKRHPKMAPYIYGCKGGQGSKGGIQIIDLRQTLPLFKRALVKIESVVAKGGKVLIVGTKPQAAALVKEAAESAGQCYVNCRWLGGTLTNWETVRFMIRKMEMLKGLAEDPTKNFKKKERVMLNRNIEKYERLIGSLAKLTTPPDLLVVLDANLGKIALKEAMDKGIPVVGLFDSNTDPSQLDHSISCMVPGNDDSVMSISLFLKFVVDACISGLEKDVQRMEAGVVVDKEKKSSDLRRRLPVRDRERRYTRAPLGAPLTNTLNKTSNEGPKRPRTDDQLGHIPSDHDSKGAPAAG